MGSRAVGRLIIHGGIMKVFALVVALIVGLAGLTLSVVDHFQLSRQLTAVQHVDHRQARQIRDLETNQEANQPTIDYMSQFNGWYSQCARTDDYGFCWPGQTWYMPAVNEKPTG